MTATWMAWCVGRRWVRATVTVRFRFCGGPRPRGRKRRPDCRPHMIGFRRIAARQLTGRVRVTAAFKGTRMRTVLVRLDEYVNGRLHRKREIRLSKVKCFRVALRTTRPVRSLAAHTSGIGLGSVGFRTSESLGDLYVAARLQHSGCGPRSTSLSRRRVSQGLARCFTARPILAHAGVRSLYDFARDVTDQRVHELGTRNGLRGVKGPARPVCITKAKCCRG